MAPGFLLRRVASDACKLDLNDVAQLGLGENLLETMGEDLGAIHAAHRRAPLILGDLAQRQGDWLHRASAAAQQSIAADLQDLLANVNGSSRSPSGSPR